ncbi:MAG: hypothetical protein Q8M79_09425 [Dehalococcoidia bacterium]|nr:hypothetical protein [Dehalococcoidia bacterium]
MKDTIEINFEGVKAASPSFLDAFMGGLGEIVEEATLTSVQDESLMDLLERVIERRGFQQRFRILATV